MHAEPREPIALSAITPRLRPEPETDKSEDVLSVMFGRISGGGQSKSFDGCAECVRKLVELRELVKVQLYRELAKG